MSRVVPFMIVLTMLVCGIVTDASAQMSIGPSHSPLTKEIAIVASGSSFFDLTGFGARVTVNRSDWLGAEASLDAKKTTASGPAQGLLIVNARLMLPSNGTRDSFLMLTAGGAVGMGFRQRLSPMIGVGVLKPIQDGPVAVRVDFQSFPGGLLRKRFDWRTTVGVAVSLH